MKINSKKNIIPIAFLLALALLASGTVYFYAVKNSLLEKQEEELEQNYCLADDEIASYEIKKEKDLTYSEATVIISVKNKNTNLEKYDFKIHNVRENYHPVEVHKCGVYIVRMFNYNPKKSKQDPGYRKELWRYDYNGNGEILILLAEKPKEFISYYSPDFRVNSTEIHIALERGYLGKDNHALIIKNIKTKEDAFVFLIKEIIDKYPDIIGSTRLDGWSDDGRYFWFDTHAGAMRLGFVRIDTITWKADIFPAPENVMGGDALNFDTGYVTVHPYNKWYGIYEIEQVEKKKMREESIDSEIYIESLITGKRHFVDKTDEPLWFFKPKWISETELEYYLPSGEKKVYEIVE